MRSANTLTRAELVRQRQNQVKQVKIDQKSKAVQQPTKKPSVPIVSRNQAFAVSYPAVSKQSVRRQYNYSIGATGAAIRLPAISSINIGWRFLSLFLGVFCLISIFLLLSSNEFKVQQIETSGLVRLTGNDLNAVLNASGESIVFFDAAQAKRDLSIAFPELRDIQISVSFPNVVHIQAIERQPVLNWKTEKQTYWLDAEGVLIPPRGQVDNLLSIIASVPPPTILSTDEIDLFESQVVSAEEGISSTSVVPLASWGEKVDPTLIDAANQLAAFIPPGSEILYNNIHGMGWKAEQGWDVYVGLTLNDINYKLNAYQALLEKFNSEGIYPSMVSIEFAQRPYYRE